MVSSIRTDHNIYKSSKREQSRVINGDFAINNELKPLFILRLNVVLGFLLIVSILVSMISYSMVIAKENKLAVMNNVTSEISFENIELQTKVDNVKSLYTINKKAEKINFLKKADRVLEVKGLTHVPAKKNLASKIKVQPVSGY